MSERFLWHAAVGKCGRLGVWKQSRAVLICMPRLQPFRAPCRAHKPVQLVSDEHERLVIFVDMVSVSEIPYP